MGNTSSDEASEGWKEGRNLHDERSEDNSQEFGSPVDLALDSQMDGIWRLLKGEGCRVQMSFRRTPTSIEEAESLLGLLEKIRDLGDLISTRFIDSAGNELIQEASPSLPGNKAEKELALRVEQLSLRTRKLGDRRTNLGSGERNQSAEGSARKEYRRSSSFYLGE